MAYSEPRTSEVLICGFATTRSEPVAFCKYVSTSSLTSGCPRAELAEPLTPRESEVLQMVASGLANEEICPAQKVRFAGIIIQVEGVAQTSEAV